MTDERMRPVLEAWFKGRDIPPADPHRSTARIMTHVPQIQQRSRWWPLPAFGRSSTPSTSSQTTGSQPTPIPATNGQAPIAIGRTQSMFSPVKAITAGVIVFALGGVLLIAQPSDRQGTNVPGAVSDTATVDPVWVTGTELLGATCEEATSRIDDGVVMRARGWHCDQQTWATSDPRLTGDVKAAWNADVYRTADGEYPTLAAGTYDLRNGGGGWHCEYADALKQSPSPEPDGLNDKTVTCIGEDGYDGLTAVLYFRWTGDGTSIEGLVFGGDIPPLPETTGA